MSKAKLFIESLSKYKIKEAYSGSTGVYSSMTPVDSSKDIITNIATMFFGPAAGSINKEDLHCTIIYSRDVASKATKTPYEVRDSLPKVVNNVRVTGCTTLSGHDKSGYVVLLLDPASDLTAMNKAWIDAGYPHSFPEYTPHITIFSNISDSKFDYSPGIKKLDKYLKSNTITVDFVDHRIEDIIEDSDQKNKSDYVKTQGAASNDPNIVGTL